MIIVKPMLPEQQLQLEQFAKQFKEGFDGSDDYKSGVNDALWHMLNLLITDDSAFFRELHNMRYVYEAKG